VQILHRADNPMQNEYMTLDNPHLQATHSDHQLVQFKGPQVLKPYDSYCPEKLIEEQVKQGGQDLRISI
jgi:hypothetical protein